MGVNIFILDRRPAKLVVADTDHVVGSLRRSWKLTEVNGARAKELSASEALASEMPSPKAAMLADVLEMPLGSPSGLLIRAHLVIGWDEGRTRVTDFGWDYLPVLGYAVRDPDSARFILHEERDQALHRIDHARAIELGLIGEDGQLLSHGQPVIAECRSVRPYIAGYAEADCTLADGRAERFLIAIDNDQLPPAEWLIGKRPTAIERFLSPLSAEDGQQIVDLSGKRPIILGTRLTIKSTPRTKSNIECIININVNFLLIFIATCTIFCDLRSLVLHS